MRVFTILALLAFAVLLPASCNSGRKKENTITSKKDNRMTAKDFTTTIVVDQTPKEAYNAINNVRGWWSEDIEGSTDKLNEVFNYHFKDIHRCRIKITEMVPEKKVVWLVEDSYFSFTKDAQEWKGTKMLFDISTEGDKTRIILTHQGLVPEHECYSVCYDAWTGFIQNSLKNLIATGKGQPNPKDGINTINAENIKKHGVDK